MQINLLNQISRSTIYPVSFPLIRFIWWWGEVINHWYSFVLDHWASTEVIVIGDFLPAFHSSETSIDHFSDILWYIGCAILHGTIINYMIILGEAIKIQPISIVHTHIWTLLRRVDKLDLKLHLIYWYSDIRMGEQYSQPSRESCS
jgi:hypothetical protein